MEFLDSIELEPESTQKKSLRVQSWYLYEQYKSLEKNQIDAAQKLKEKSFQDRLLHQELSERRARRRLSGRPSFAGRASVTPSVAPSDDVQSCVSSDDFFESLCTETNIRGSSGTSDHCASPTRYASPTRFASPEPCVSPDQCASPDPCASPETCNSPDPCASPEACTSPDPCASPNPCTSPARCTTPDRCSKGTKDEEYVSKNCSLNSVVAKMYSSDSLVFDPTISSSNLADDIKEELELVKKNIAENINLQLETVRENTECLKEFAKLRDTPRVESEDEGESETESSTTSECDEDSVSSVRCGALALRDDYNGNAYALWTKLVSFAYQIIQLNHGNCYYDYSSQFLTAVLACDVLRRGVNKMCNILQPYISPIKYATDPCCSSNLENNIKRKSTRIKKYNKKSIEVTKNKKHGYPIRGVVKPKLKSLSATFNGEKRYQLKNWRPKCSDHVMGKKKRIASESASDNYSSTIWPGDFSSEEYCRCQARVANPMLKVVTCIDGFLRDMGQSAL